MRENQQLKKLIIVSMLIAIEIILTRMLGITLPFARFSLGFIPMAVCAILYGPYWAGIAYAAADAIGITLIANGTPHPGFTLTAFLTGFTWGFFLYKKHLKPSERHIKFTEVIVPGLIIGIILNLGLDTYWLMEIMHKGFWGLLPTRIIKISITIPLQILLVPLVWNKLSKHASSLF